MSASPCGQALPAQLPPEQSQLAIMKFFKSPWTVRALSAIFVGGSVFFAARALRPWIEAHAVPLMVTAGALLIAEYFNLKKSLCEYAELSLFDLEKVEGHLQRCLECVRSIDYRVHLSFAAQWHNISLQAAFKLLTYDVIAAPDVVRNHYACMGAIDEREAQCDVLPCEMGVLLVDSCMQRFVEKMKMRNAGYDFSDIIKKALDDGQGIKDLWARTVDLTEGCDIDDWHDEVRIAVQGFAEKCDVSHPVFQ